MSETETQAETAAEETPSEETTAPANEDGAPAPSFLDGLSADDRVYASKIGVASGEDAFRVLKATEAKLSAPTERLLEMPGPDDSEADAKLSAVYGKLGRPDDADGYKVPELSTFKFSDDAERKETLDGFHQLNLTQDQQAGVMAMLDGKTKAAEEAMIAAAEKAVSDAEQSLKKDWGEAYDERMRVVQHAANERGEAFRSMLDMTGLGNQPEMAKLLYDLASATKEPSQLDGMKNADFGKRAPEEAANELRDFETKYADVLSNRNHPDHAARAAKRLELIKEAGPLAA